MGGLFVLAVVAALAGAQEAGAQRRRDPRWLFVGEGEEFASYLDSSRVGILPRGVVSVWERREFALVQVHTDGPTEYSVSLIRYNVDCTGQLVDVVEWVDYDSTGKVVKSSLPQAEHRSAWSSPPPDSVGEALMRVACRLMARRRRKP